MKKINNAIYSFSIKQLLKQPLTIVYLIVFSFAILLSSFLTLKVNDNKVIGLRLLKISFEEPYLVSTMVSTLVGFLLWIILFTIILITNKFLGDLIKSPLLDIFIAKLKSKKIIIDSSLIGSLALFLIPLIFLAIFISLVFYLKFNLIVINYILVIICYYTLVIIYILTFSFFVIQIFDEFFSSLFILIIIVVSSPIINLANGNVFLTNILNILFPISSLTSFLIKNISGNFYFEPYIILSLITSFCFYWLGIKKFQKENN